MSDVLLDNQTGASVGTPGAGASGIFVDSTAFIICTKDQNGIYRGRSNNCAIASQGAGFASDTYVTNSNVLVPSFGVQAKTKLAWRISVSKTGAGVAAPVFQIRIGAAASTADTSRVSLTGPAQTAVIDAGVYTIMATVRSVGVSGVIQGTLDLSHNGAAVGLANNDASAVEAASSAFDNTALAGLNIGLSVNGGASAAWTVTQVHVEADW